MNKKDLTEALAAECDLSNASADRAVGAVFDSITEALKKNDDVKIIGFGTFSVSKRKATTGRNPRTGETIQIPASNVARFKAGKALKDALN